MKTNVLKTKFVVATQHLRLPVRPQRERRMPAPNGVLPKMRECFGRSAKNRIVKSGTFLLARSPASCCWIQSVLNRGRPLDDFLDGIGRVIG